MIDKELALINAVKYAVAKYGIGGVTTRNVGGIANVNDAYIYRYFKNKDELLLKAYIKENGEIFKSMLYEIDRAHTLDLGIKEKARVSFDVCWANLLSNPERLNFCVTYYSHCFEYAHSYHEKQIDELIIRFGFMFENDNDCRHAMYSICSVLYDSSYACIKGRAENTAEYANRVFETSMAIFFSQMKRSLQPST